jgi:hypothetical protein
MDLAADQPLPMKFPYASVRSFATWSDADAATPHIEDCNARASSTRQPKIVEIK